MLALVVKIVIKKEEWNYIESQCNYRSVESLKTKSYISYGNNYVLWYVMEQSKGIYSHMKSDISLQYSVYLN